MPFARIFLVFLLVTLLGACATQNWSTAQVTPTGQAPQPTTVSDSSTQTAYAVNPSRIELVEGDLQGRPYEVLGKVSVSLNKLTIFHPDPTREQAAQRLREEAAKLGADAVINVEIGEVGLGLLSWASRDAEGQAILFKR